MSKYLIENLFGIEGWSIAWYGVIIAVGMVLGEYLQFTEPENKVSRTI